MIVTKLGVLYHHENRLQLYEYIRSEVSLGRKREDGSRLGGNRRYRYIDVETGEVESDSMRRLP